MRRARSATKATTPDKLAVVVGPNIGPVRLEHRGEQTPRPAAQRQRGFSVAVEGVPNEWRNTDVGTTTKLFQLSTQLACGQPRGRLQTLVEVGCNHGFGEIDHVKWLVNVRSHTDDVRVAASARHRHRSPHGVQMPCATQAPRTSFPRPGGLSQELRRREIVRGENTSRSMPIHSTTRPARVPVAGTNLADPPSLVIFSPWRPLPMPSSFVDVRLVVPALNSQAARGCLPAWSAVLEPAAHTASAVSDYEATAWFDCRPRRTQ